MEKPTLKKDGKYQCDVANVQEKDNLKKDRLREKAIENASEGISKNRTR